MPEGGGPDLLREWQSAMQSVIPRQLLAPLRRQTELIQDVLERERRFQRELLGLLFAPLDAVFDLLEQSGATIRQQAEALHVSRTGMTVCDTTILVPAAWLRRVAHRRRGPASTGPLRAFATTRPRGPRRRPAERRRA
jgi:hypothetical protein